MNLCSRLILILLAEIFLPGSLQSQPKILPSPIVSSSQAPVLSLITPAGVQRGSHVELMLTGVNLTDPVGLWTSFPAKVIFPIDQNGNDGGRLLVHMEVAANAPIGTHSVRLATQNGLSNLRLLCVDEIPQIMENDTNRIRTTPQEVTSPVMITGKIDPESSDYYKIHVKAKQRLTFDVLAHRLGSPLDPLLILYNARTGRELPGLHSDDAPGLQTDARLTHTFAEEIDVLVEVRDSTYRGGEIISIAFASRTAPRR